MGRGRLPQERAGYREIAAQIRAEVHAGVLADGAELPPQRAMADAYGVTVTTLRRATRLLKDEGLLEARRGREGGTFVRWRPPLRISLTDYLRSLDPEPGGPFERACASQGVDGYGELVGVEHEPASAEVARGLGIREGSGVVHRRRHMRADGQVVQVQDAWLPLDLVGGTPMAAAAKVQAGTYAGLTAAGLAPVRLRREAVARMPTDAERAALGMPVGVPVVVFTRTTWAASGRAVEWMRVVAAGDRHAWVDVQEVTGT